MSPVDLDALLDRALAFDLQERRERETMRPPSSFTTTVKTRENPEVEENVHFRVAGSDVIPALRQARHRMRTSRSAEGRTVARLEVMRLEREMRAKGAA